MPAVGLNVQIMQSYNDAAEESMLALKDHSDNNSEYFLTFQISFKTGRRILHKV